MTGPDKKPGAADRDAGDKVVKTDGSLGDAEMKRLKRPVNADAFLVDRELSPEEEGLAGPLPERDEDEAPKR